MWDRGGGWAWFWAGTSIALALMLGGLIWGLTRAQPVAVTPVASVAATPTVKVGEVVNSGSWKAVVDASHAQGSTTFVDFTIKNDADQAAALEIPSTAPQRPRARTASYQETQIASPPPLELMLYDRANQAIGGSFVGADGQPSGAYTFLAAPGDAIKLTWAFDVPAGSIEPFALELRFGSQAGGAHARVALDARAAQPTTLAPSDVGKVGGKDERVEIGDLWALTATGAELAGGTLTVHLKAENLTDEAAVVAAPRGDTTGGDRDFYAVDAAGRMAYSSADTMPTTRVPAGASRNVDVKLKAPKDFATTGPYRFSVVVDATANRYAVFRIG